MRGIATLILTAALFGATYEIAAQRHARRMFPPPGEMVDLGGRRIQLDCRGEGAPTVVFESGLNLNGALNWSAVHDSVALNTRACAYSRAGMMWSDPAPRATSAKQIAEDLHRALQLASENGPFVLVGQSLGGPYVLTFTKYFGADVVGIVLVDASHPDQLQRVQAVIPDSDPALLRLGASLAWSGALRAAAARLVPFTPAQTPRVVEAIRAYAPSSLRALVAEKDALDATLREAGTFRKLGARPLHVLTAAKPLSKREIDAAGITLGQAARVQVLWMDMQIEMAAWSSRSRHTVLPNSGHGIHIEDPQAVVSAVNSVVRIVRADRSD